MSRDYFDDGYYFTTNRITLPSGEAVLITPSRNKHRLYIADLPDRIKRRCLTLPTDDHFLDNGCDQHKLCEMLRMPLSTMPAAFKRPYLNAVRLIHPDKCSAPRANEAAQLLNSAYDAVVNPG